MNSPRLHRASPVVALALLGATTAAGMLALSCGAGSARASSVFSETLNVQLPDKGAPPGFAYLVHLKAAPGEENRLTLRSGTGPLSIAEATLALTAGGGCQQVTPTAALCSAGQTTVDVLDGNDQVDDGVSATVDGGTGDDALTGSGTLTGGPGLDTLTAKPVQSPGLSDIERGPITRLVDGGGPGERDTYTGAQNNDAVSYRGRTTPIAIDLSQDSNEDRLESIRSIVGGDAADAIAGDDRANELAGGKGRDRLLGGAGNDHLYGGDDGSGDALSAGPGDDQLTAGPGDAVSCGPGTDLVDTARLPATVSVPPDCERADAGAYVLRGAPTRRGRSLFVRVDHVDDTGSVAAFAGRRLLGRARRVKRKGTYRIALNRTGRRLARRGRVIDLLDTRAYPRRTDPPPTAYRYRVR